MKEPHHSTNPASGYSKFGKNSALYAFCTENIAGYLPRICRKDAKLLSVCGSGDQILNAVLCGATAISAFDINQHALHFAELKLAALSILSFEEFQSYFFRFNKQRELNPDSLNFDIFCRLSDYLSADCARYFESLYDACSYDGSILRNSELFNNRHDTNELKRRCNLYLHSEAAYSTLKGMLPRASVEFLDCSLLELAPELQGADFDLITLSNIADYAAGIFPGRSNYLSCFVESAIRPLFQCLSRTGKICAAYLYGASHPPRSPAEAHSQIDLPELREKAFSSLKTRYNEISFPGVQENYNDAIILLENK